jgi:CubicO group peptidase (beta-lactamase class C family)
VQLALRPQLQKLGGLAGILLLASGLVPPAPASAQENSLSALLDEIQLGRHGSVTSIIVQRNGHIVFERYFGNTTAKTRHDVRSATKSISSLVIGIAIDRGILRGADEPILGRLPDLPRPAHGLDPALTLEDLLTMRSGLACDDWVPASLGNEDKMYESHNWLSFWAALPRAHERGRHFSYCTGNVMAAAALVARHSGMRFSAFAERFLFRPLGIEGATWASDPSGATDAGGHLLLSARDMLAVGQLVLSRGRVRGQRVVSEGWVQRATSARTPVYERRYHYGYYWWTDDIPVAGTDRRAQVSFAWGNGGNYIFVVPAAELVVVFTGRNFNNNAFGLQPQRWMSSHILPAFLRPAVQ